MSFEEIKQCFYDAWHEIGHAYAFVGESRFLAAQIAARRALDLIKKAHGALDKLQD